jgi:hypothetical protein
LLATLNKEQKRIDTITAKVEKLTKT